VTQQVQQENTQQKSLTPVELKAVALCLRYLEREVRVWGCDTVDMVPPFTPQEMVELKNAVYAQDSGEAVTEDEEYLEELSLSSLYAHLLKRIGADIPELEE
jgi:hypothetical protein